MCWRSSACGAKPSIARTCCRRWSGAIRTCTRFCGRSGNERSPMVPYHMRFCLLLLLAIFPAAAQRPFTAEDYNRILTVGDPQLSPDETLAAYTVTRVDAKQNRRYSDIWVPPVDGRSAPRPYTATQSATLPRWSAAGLAFLSARSAPDGTTPRPQVWLLPAEGGEPRRLTNLKNGGARVP